MVPPFCFEFRDLARLLNLLVSCGVLKGHTIGGPTTFVTLGHGQDVQLCSGVLPSRLPPQGIVIAVLRMVRIKITRRVTLEPSSHGTSAPLWISRSSSSSRI